ncbi:MAG: hypothetical protein AAFY56_12885 [Pseudomonadota bacterium]
MSANHASREQGDASSPVDRALMLEGLVNELIPGGDGWPSASSIGVQGLVALRFCEEGSERDLGVIAKGLVDAGGPFAGRPPDERVEIVKRFEAAAPKLFERVQAAATLAYYESPFVAEAIRRLGRPYSPRPHLTGYPMKPFDLDKDKPTHGRGAYTPTDAVQRLDTTGLHLEETRTELWGVKR